MDEDEENKGCYVRRRRSSILKLPLAGIDINKQVKQEERNKKKRLSKRVSFAETLDVWEFNKESQSENADKNAFRNKDDNDKEISGIDSLLTGEIKNPTHAIENISDPEDSDDEGKTATLNCSVFQSPEKDVIIQNVSAIANKENINSVVSSPININCDDVSPVNQSMCSPPDLDNTPKKLDNKLFFQQLMQKIKISPSSSKDNSPVVNAAVCPSMSTKMFLDNLIQSTKDETSFSDGVFDSKENLSNVMDTSTSGSVSNSPALDKSVYYIESSKPVDSTIYFNHNPDQTASMDFTICNSKVFSESFKMENLSEKKGTYENVTQCLGNLDDTNANMELTVCTDNKMASMLNLPASRQNSNQKNNNTPTDEVTIHFGPEHTQIANMDLTACHDRPFGCSRIDHMDKESNQKMTTPGDVTMIFNETKDTMANMELTLCTIQNPISFLDFSRKSESENVKKESKIEAKQINRESLIDSNPKEKKTVNMELISCATKQISSYPSFTKKMMTEDEKENVLPSISQHSGEIKLDKSIKQLDKFHSAEMNCKKIPKDVGCEIKNLRENEKVILKLQGNFGLNSDFDKENILEAKSAGLTEKSMSSVSFIELPVKKSSPITDVENTSSTNVVKKPVKRVSFMCPEEQPGKELCQLDEDEPPIKKLSTGNQVDLFSQNSGSTDGQQQVNIKDPLEKSVNFMDEVISKKNSTKSGAKRVSFYDPEEHLSKNTGPDSHDELPAVSISLTKSTIEKSESIDSAAKRVASTNLDEPLTKKVLLENVMDRVEIKSDAVDLEKSLAIKPSLPESTNGNTCKGSSTNLEFDSLSKAADSTDNRALKSVKKLYLSLNTSGILKSSDMDIPKSEFVHEDLPKSVEKQISFFAVDDEVSVRRKGLIERGSDILINPDSQAVKSSVENRSESQNCLNRSAVLKPLVIQNSVENEFVDKNSTKTAEKRVSFFSTDEKPLVNKTCNIIHANTDPQSTISPEETNERSYINLNSSLIQKSFIKDENPDIQRMNKNLTQTLEKSVAFCSVTETNTIEVAKPVAHPQPANISEDKSETNKNLYISLDNSAIVKSFGSGENCSNGQLVDKNLNKADKTVSFPPADEEYHDQKSNSIGQNQLPNCVVDSSKKSFETQEPINPSCDHESFNKEPTLTRSKKCASPQAEKMTVAEPLIKENSSQKDKEINIQVAELVKQPVANQVDLEEIPKPERLTTSQASLSKVPNFKTWQRMFSIENVIKNVRQSRSGLIPVASCEPTKAEAMPAVNIMQPTIAVSESIGQFSSKELSQDEASVAKEIKDKTKNTYRNMVTNKFSGESQTTNMTTKPVADSILLPIIDTNSCNLLTSQLSSQDAKVKTAKNTSLKAQETTSDNFEKDSSIVYDLNFKVEDLSGIMNERSDILIENSPCESTIHVSQNRLSSSIVSNRPSFSTKSVDDVKSSILALSNISSSLCSRMLINMHLPTLEKNLSTVEVESIEELLLLIGIDKLENVTIDYRRTSVDLAPLGSESKTIGEKLLMSCLEQPTYQSILQTYDSLTADEHYLLKEFHSQKLLEDFQIALKKKEASKSNDELKNGLLEAFKKSRQLSQQKVKQRKAERYVNLCSLLKEKVVVLEEAKSQLDDISQKIDQQLDSLDEVLETLNKEFDHLNTLPQLTDEDLEQYVQVKKYLDDADTIQTQEQKLSNQCCQLRDQEKTLKEEYSNLEMLHANLLKPLSLDTSSLVNNCQKLKIYSVLFPWKLWQLCDDQQKYNFWNDTFQFCIHTQAEHIKKAHFELDENWQSVVKGHPWLQIAHEMRLDVMQEKSFLECLQHVSQLPQLLHRIGNLLSNLQDLAKEIHAISLKKVITRKQSSILVTYCSSQLTKVQVCFQFDPSNYPTTTIRHQVNLHYGNVRCEDINRRLQRIKPGPQYLSRLVNAVQLESVSNPW